jgi:hypothetical protein
VSAGANRRAPSNSKRFGGTEQTAAPVGAGASVAPRDVVAAHGDADGKNLGDGLMAAYASEAIQSVKNTRFILAFRGDRGARRFTLA